MLDTCADLSAFRIVPGLSNVVQVGLGFSHSCAWLDGGAVKCWGWNSAGQLGDDSTTDRWSPTLVAW